jgi:hypothetical protein
MRQKLLTKSVSSSGRNGGFYFGWAMVAWMEGIPQRLKPLFSFPLERPKAEALGYLQATASARQRQLQKQIATG